MRTATLLLPVLSLLALPAAADYSAHPRAARLLAELEHSYGFGEGDLAGVRAALGQAKAIPALIEAEQKAPEKTETWTTYSAKRVDAPRIRRGARFLLDQRELLARAEAEYGVPPGVVAGVLGLETNFGRITGGARVLDALATQGFEHPTRSDFFLGELAQFFAFCRDFGFAPTELKGSYAGAMGWAQFMPSNYRRLAVDFDGDGRRNLWSAADAIGSIARYLRDYDPAASWRRGEPLVVRARLDGAPAAALPRNRKYPTHTAAQLAAEGVRSSVKLPAELPVGLVELELDQGQEYWVALPNFYSLMSYNPRVYYAMTVTRLAQAIADEAARLDPAVQ